MLRKLLPIMLAVGLGVIACAALALLTQLPPSEPPAYVVQATAEAAATATARADLLAAQAQATNAPWVAGAVVFVVGLLVLAAGVGLWQIVQEGQADGYALVHEARRDARYVVVDGVELDRRLLRDPAFAATTLQISATRAVGVAAQLRDVPQTLHQHYAPHVQYAPPAALPQNLGAQEPLLSPHSSAPVPTFADLRAQGRIGAGQPLMLGWGADGALVGTWKDLYSTAVAGISGSGKTTLERFIIGQAALHGARLALLDPHAGKEGDSLAATLAPLAPAFLCDPATDERAMLRTLELLDGILQARLTGRDRDRTPLIAVVDEFSRLMGRNTLAGPMGRLLEAIAQEGRGVGCYAMISGQIWSATRAGGTELRDSLASAYVMRIRTRQARMLINVPEIADCETLPTGGAYFWRASGAVDRLAIPNTTQADIAAVAALYPSRPQAARKPPASRPPSRPPAALPAADALRMPTGGLETEPPPSAEEAQIVALFRGGTDIPAIIAQIWNIPSSNPRAYAPKYQQVQAVLRRALGGEEPNDV